MKGLKPQLQNTLLIIGSIFFALVFLEGALHITGLTYRYAQKWNNGVHLDDVKEIRILCLGESTTALGMSDSYPSRLRSLLKEKYPDKKIVVINEGEPGTSTAGILKKLFTNLQRYKPHIAILMMGINDNNSILTRPGEELLTQSYNPFVAWFKKRHTVRLITAIGINVSHMIDKPKAYKSIDPIPAPFTIDEARAKIANQDYYEAEKILLDLVKEEHPDPSALFHLGLVKTKLGEPLKALKLFQRQMKIAPTAKSAFEVASTLDFAPKDLPKSYHLEKLRFFKLAHDLEPENLFYLEEYSLALIYFEEFKTEAEHYLRKAVQQGSKSKYVLRNLASFVTDVNLASKYFKLAIKQDPFDFSLRYPYLLHLMESKQTKKFNTVLKQTRALFPHEENLKQFNKEVKIARTSKSKAKKKLDRAAENFNSLSAERNGLLENPTTQKNYRKIVKILLKNNVIPIAMQYPLRDIELIQKMFRESTNLIFVENKKNFQEALKEKDYGEVFSDKFAGDFGHFKREGSDIIAESILSALVRNALLPTSSF